MTTSPLYDCLIIGGGPAGLTAAIYLARFMRNVLVIDKETGRSNYEETNENYMGFPHGIKAKELRHLGKMQAEKYGAQFTIDDVLTVEKNESHFYAKGENNEYQGKTILLATGVIDLFPPFPEMKQYIGKSLFWCITCDGYKTRGKKVVIVGHTNEAVTTALQFLLYTDEITFILNCSIEQATISNEMKKRLHEHSIPFIEGYIQRVEGKNGFMNSIILTDGQKIPADFIFNQQGAVPNSILAKKLHVALDDKDYIKVDLEQRTSVPFVYAAGDVTKPFSHQIVTASHEGSMAAQAVNYDLYEPYQRE